ncbi:MAG: methylated-DNA--[protein]-cysteine S-methyltransferase [Parachlamydiales bacterium]|nr:methylated-DNA--[protein]-cysteine S-methyltransferase [Parachlamydiales bacterium]
MIRIADRPSVIVNFSREGCTLSLPDESGFFCRFGPLSAPLKDLYLHYLQEYCQGRSLTFPFPRNTSFDERVWEMISTIAFGETRTYSDLARQLGMPHAARAVGGACGRNPMPIFIPCHRVIAKNSKIGGFAFNLEIKKRLIEFEGQKKTFLPHGSIRALY